MLAAILGVKTSLQAASNSKPFSMEGFEKKGKGGAAGGEGPPMEPHERDTAEQDAPNGDWLTDPMCVSLKKKLYRMSAVYIHPTCE